MRNAKYKNWKSEVGSCELEPDGAARRPQSSALSTQHCRIRGFTLIEMVVAVALLVVIILAVGQIFRNASGAIGLAQATSEVVSNVRGAQLQIEQDIAGLDRRGFMTIKTLTAGTGTIRSDQIVFTTVGSFTNYTTANSYSSAASANAAIIQYDQAGTYVASPTTTSPAYVAILARQVTALCVGTSYGTPGQIYGTLSLTAPLPAIQNPAAITTPPTVPASTTDCFKMMPIMLQGVSSFAVDWTMSAPAAGALVWTSPTTTATTFSNDSNGGTYPKALRFTYTVTDTKNVLQGGRTFVHIVKLPD